MPRTLYLIDGHAQIFRAFFAIRGPMNSPVTGEPTNATFAFTGMLLKLLSQFQPTHAVMVIDVGGKKNFREEMFAEYKATRNPTPPDLIAQEPRILEITRNFGLPVIGIPGVEADDIIGCLTKRITDDPRYADVNVRIVSKDKDLEQLLSDRVTMFDIQTDTTIDTNWLKENKGITPQQVVDVLALTGDTVDNVPGVEGIGPKTASQLVQQFGSVENILANLDQITGKKRENLEKSREVLALSKKLVTLECNLTELPASELEQLALVPPNAEALRKTFTELGFHKHVTDLQKLVSKRWPELADTSGPNMFESASASTAPKSSSAAVTTPGKRSKSSKSSSDDAGMFGGLFDEAPAQAELDKHDARALSSQATEQGCDYRAVTTLDDLRALVNTLQQQTIVAIDTETSALGPEAKLCGISLAWQEKAAVYIPVLSPQMETHLDLPTVLRELGPWVADENAKKTGHNLKFDHQALRRAGFNLRGIAFDSMIASYLLNMPGHGIDHLSLSLLNLEMVDITRLIGVGSRNVPQRSMAQVPLEMVVPYASADADIALRLYHLLRPRLAEQGMTELADQIEMPLVHVLAEMELAGIRVEPTELNRQKEILAKRIDELRDQICEAAGCVFNLDSPKQLGDVLFKKLGLPVQKRTQTGPSTDIEVLEKLAELEGLPENSQRVPKLLVEYRQLTKLVGTYLEALVESISKIDGRVRASFHQAGTSTGRLSSSNPNLQNIPIRTPVGREIRKAFVAEPGHLLVSADYSQIELRILAHLSQDPALIEAFAKDLDIHTAVAAQVFNVPLDQVTKDQRGSAKTINFGIIYGVTAFGLARRIEGLNLERARDLIASYRKRYAGISSFLDQCIEQAKLHGFVATMLGHRRPITEVNDSNPNRRALGERLAINSVVQGSAADLIKLAMVNLQRRIEREKLPLKLLLQIHDELVCEAPADQAQAMSLVLKQEMETAMKLDVPLKVEVGIGRDWFEAK